MLVSSLYFIVFTIELRTISVFALVFTVEFHVPQSFVFARFRH